MGKIIIFLMMSLMLSSCGKPEPSEYYDTAIDILIEDAQGNSLFELTHERYIDVSKAKIYYFIKGLKEYQYNSLLDCPSSLCAISEHGIRYARLFPYETKEDEYSLTHIQWNETDTDTVKCHYIRGDGSVTLDSVWYNGEFIFPDQGVPGLVRGIRIIK